METSIEPRKTIDWRAIFRQYGLLIPLLLLVITLSRASDRFLTVDNLLNVLRQSSINGIIAIGMMLVILTRGIDLSVGSMLALATVVSANLLKNKGVDPVSAIGAGLLVGGALGLVNGLIVSQLKVPPFIATLGMMTFARGAALSYTGGKPITGLGELREGYRALGSGSLFGIPLPVVVMLVVFVLVYILLSQTNIGRYIRALGDNEQAAYLSGLSVRRIQLLVYTLAGVFSALAGVILVGRLNSAQPTAGVTYELDAIAAVVVGGTSFEGGTGTVFGTFIGVLIIAMLDNGLNLLNYPAFYQDIVKGAVIVLALLIYRFAR